MATNTINFWGFSGLLYQQENVEPACLSLQDDSGLDVNLVLFCCWFGLFRGQLCPQTLEPVQQYSRHWQQQVVQPLRQVRRNLKKARFSVEPDTDSAISELRTRIKAEELNAERLQQNRMERLVAELKSTSPDSFMAGVRNCEHNIQLILAPCDKQEYLTTQQQIHLIMPALEFVYRRVKDRPR